MTPLQMLERYYMSAVHLDAPKDYFLALADYFDYAETIPEFDLITSEISAEPQPLFDKLAAQEKVALEKLAQVRAELEDYIKKNKVVDPVIQNALKEYDDYKERRTVGIPLQLSFAKPRSVRR